jgi:probable HAF family extracellular repeat protein
MLRSLRGAVVGAVAFCAVALAAPVAPAAVVTSFQGLGDLPGGNVPYSTAGGISRDGTVVVGTSTEGNNFSVFRWTKGGGMTPIGVTRPTISGGDSAAGVSDDGAVVVGEHSFGLGGQGYAYRHTAAGGIYNLGKLSVDGNPGTASRALAVSGDGSVVVGQSEGPTSNGSFRYQAFRWTPARGMVGLGFLSPGATTSVAADVSADGSVVVGSSEYSKPGSNPYHAYRWTQGGGMVSLGDLLGGTDTSFAAAVSSDGNVVVGNSRSQSGREAFRWTQGGGMVGLGDLPGGNFESFALDVSDNGVIVGVGSATSTARDYEAFIWDEAHGMRRLQTVLTDAGLDLTGWKLTDVAGISADGTTIAGTGLNPAGRAEAWVAVVVPEPAGLAVVVASASLLFRRRRV